MSASVYQPFTGLPSGAPILLAFSGGVDSAVAAHLCRTAGFAVTAICMRLLPEDAGKRAEYRRKVADKLGIELIEWDLTGAFRETVMRRTWEEFAAGRTPNPCALCNPFFKFGYLGRYAAEHGFAALATGHYVRNFRAADGTSGRLFRGLATGKDQSYFLFGLSREQVRFACFPLGELTKPEVREIARGLNLPNADAPESQDICFAASTGTPAEDLRKLFRADMPGGTFVRPDGTVLGRHTGIHQYTIGQRKGTGIALGHPAYVQRIDAARNEVVITDRNEDLLCAELRTAEPNWQTPSAPSGAFEADVQIRYRSKAVPGLVIPQPDGGLHIRFRQPLRAVTPGQAAVVYRNDELLGGGWIR